MKKIYRVFYLLIGQGCYEEHDVRYYSDENQALTYWSSLIPQKTKDINGMVEIDHEFKSIVLEDGYEYIELETITLNDGDDIVE